ncbi:MAG: dynamin family protein [Chloroflexota bacterium]|nr:dynamin family protein [Chloroflexota bacterium]
MLNPILNKQQSEILKAERRTIQRLLALLSGWEAQEKDIAILQQALEQLDELFLLVIVGEFNAGKSALINALLGERYLTEGVTPTTAQIHILRYGNRGEPLVENGILVLHYPADFLKEISIVDTPGTNAVLRQHEEISRDFVPRSDLILFVTSADRPFSESERAFLELIHEWGKKVIIILNKFDLLETEEEQAKVLDFVRDNAARLIGTEPELFPISARTAMRAKVNEEETPEHFARLEQYLFNTLNEESRIRLKLGNPLGVALKVTEVYLQKAEQRLALLNEDLRTIEQVERQLKLYRKDLENEFEYHTLKIDSILNEMQRRGDDFFDDTFRVSRILSLMNTGAIKQQFEREVITNTPEQIERQVQEMIDWMVDRESRQWRMLARQLGQRHRTEFLQDAAAEAAGGFEYNRRQLLQNVGRSTADVVARYDSSREAAELGENVQQALAMVGIAEVGAIGLGAALTVALHGALVDATGILAAGLVGLAGLGIIPYRRNEAKKTLHRKLDKLRSQLHRVLLDAFHQEADRSAHRLGDAIDPYSRFVRTECQRLEEIHRELGEVRDRLQELRETLTR